jgi:hypothetical protein
MQSTDKFANYSFANSDVTNAKASLYHVYESGTSVRLEKQHFAYMELVVSFPTLSH